MYYITDRYGNYFANFGDGVIELVAVPEAASRYDTYSQALAVLAAYNSVYYNDEVLVEVIEL